MSRIHEICSVLLILMTFAIILLTSVPLQLERNHVTYQQTNHEQGVNYHNNHSNSSNYPMRKEQNSHTTSRNHSEQPEYAYQSSPDASTESIITNEQICKQSLIEPRRAVLVYASTRSGSTFLGEFFNQHPSVYYLFEPLHSINHTSPNRSSVYQSTLSDLFHCNYSRITDLYKNSVNDIYSNCRSNVCFFTRSKFLWRNTELCKLKHPRCVVKKFNPQILSKVCRQSLLTGVKVVRLPSLSEISPLLKDKSLDLKVIQLIRDPRAVVPSRIKMAKVSINSTAAFSKALCDQYLRDWLYFKSCIDNGNGLSFSNDTSSVKCDEETRTLWRGKYMRLSHEYISENPKEAMKKVYEFAKLNIDSDVFAWLKSTTNAKANDKRRFFGTKRNSQRVIKEWRLQQNFSQVVQVQNHCGKIMEHYGYILAMSREHLRNVTQKFYSFDKALFAL